jgi:hypothetical protein
MYQFHHSLNRKHHLLRRHVELGFMTGQMDNQIRKRTWAGIQRLRTLHIRPSMKYRIPSDSVLWESVMAA